MRSPIPSHLHMPYKSSAVALLFSAILGPVGLLYASFWGGLSMIVLAIVAICNQFFFVMLLVWLISCIWSVRSVELYNKKLMRTQAAPYA